MREHELKIRLRTEEGRAILDSLASRERVGQIVLGPVTELRINDVYFDSSQLILHQGNAYLRLRIRDGERLITLRVPGGLLSEELDEVTHHLNDKGLRWALDLLAQKDLLLHRPDFSRPDFSDVLCSAGLFPMLKISIRRQVRPLSVKHVTVGVIKLDEFIVAETSETQYEIETDVYKQMFIPMQRMLHQALLTELGETGVDMSVSKLESGLVSRFAKNE